MQGRKKNANKISDLYTKAPHYTRKQNLLPPLLDSPATCHLPPYRASQRTMAPYTGLSLSGSFASSTKGYRDSKDDVVFQLTERLREREDELRQVCRDRDRLEDQLKLRGNLPVHLDVAYEELLVHCKEREEEYKKATEQHQRETLALEDKCHDLEDKCHDLEEKLEEQTRMFDKYEQEITDERDDMENEIRKCHHQLELAVEEIEEKEKHMISLETVVDRLKIENDRLLDRVEEDKAVIAQIGKRVDTVKELEMLNFQLEERLERCEELLGKKDEDLNNCIRLHQDKMKDMELRLHKVVDLKDEDLNNYIQLHQDELKNMEHRLHKVIDMQRRDLQERDREVIMLTRDIEKYEDILEQADYVTREQRDGLRARQERIDELSMAIEKRENSDLFSHLDKFCTM